MPDIAEMPDLDAAIARLDALEAAETPPPAEAFTQTEVESPETQQPPSQPEPGTQAPDSKPSDTPAAPETKPSAEPKQKSETQKPADAKGSPFAKDAQRRDSSWKELERQKKEHRAAEATLKAERDLFQREQESFKVQQAKSSQKFTPEQYEQASAGRLKDAETLELQAAGWERKAEELESAGQYAEAEKARASAKDAKEQALGHRGMSRQLKDYAKHVREHPDPTLQQMEQRNQQLMRDYTLKAAEQWPDLAKEGSEFQKQVAGHLQEARKQGIDPREHPIMMYHAARLTAAETAAARVPAMVKELGELKAKVKELELLTAPGGGTGAAQRLNLDNQPASDEDEGAQLRSMAASLG